MKTLHACFHALAVTALFAFAPALSGADFLWKMTESKPLATEGDYRVVPAGAADETPMGMVIRGMLLRPDGVAQVRPLANTQVRIDSIDQTKVLLRFRCEYTLPSRRGGNWQLAMGYGKSTIIQLVLHVESPVRHTLRIGSTGPGNEGLQVDGTAPLAFGQNGVVELVVNTATGEVTVLDGAGLVICRLAQPALFKSTLDSFVPLRDANTAFYGFEKRAPESADTVVLRSVRIWTEPAPAP